MFVLITGGSASGKSEYAGALAERMAAGAEEAEHGRILYIATLADRSPESAERVARHRKLREKGPYDVAECFSMRELAGIVGNLRVHNKKSLRESSGPLYNTVLFDSLDGFASNVLFGTEDFLPESEKTAAQPEDTPAEDVFPPAGFFASWRMNTAGEESGEAEMGKLAENTFSVIKKLYEVSENLIIVSDMVYCDGIQYDRFTRLYMEYTAAAEQLSAAAADCVIEVICGIPLLLKGENHEFFKIIHHNDVSIYKNPHAGN